MALAGPLGGSGCDRVAALMGDMGWIEQAPASWRAAAVLGRKEWQRLPQPGEDVAVVALGSGEAAAAYAALREHLGLGATHTGWIASDPATHRRIVVLTRTGAEATVASLIRHLQMRAVLTTVLTAAGDSEAAELGGHTLVIDDPGNDDAFDLAALALLRGHLRQDTDRLIADAERALAEPDPPGSPPFSFVGHGWAEPLAALATRLTDAAPGGIVWDLSSMDEDAGGSLDPMARLLGALRIVLLGDGSREPAGER